MDYKDVIKTILTQQLTHMQIVGFPTSTEGLNALQVEEISTYPAQPELDDEPITSTTRLIPTHLDTYPYCFTVTLPTYNPSTYGLLFLAIRQARWTTSILDTLILTFIANNIRQTLLQQLPTVIRSNTEDPKLSRDTCIITSLAFTRLRPTNSYRTFKASAIHTTIKLLTASEYRFQHERATAVNELSPPLQALLQILDAVQPATYRTTDDRSNTISFIPMDVDYNPFRLQFMPCALHLTHPDSPTEPTKSIIRPPRLRTNLKGDNY